MRRQRQKGSGSVVLDRRIKVWNFFFWENGKRRSKKIGTVAEFPTKASAWRAAMPLRHALENEDRINNNKSTAPSVSTLVEQYRAEKMPQRYSTRRGYEVWLRRIVKQWGTCLLTEVQARPVELWLVSLTLAPKSKAELRGLLRIIWDFAMWKGDIPTQRNPMELVTVKDATKRMRQPRSLTVEEFQKFIQHLEGPFRLAALLCVCLGLRISECLALRWADVDWLGARLHVERGIVRQRVSEVKTEGSRKSINVNAELLAALQAWKQSTQFSSADDWIFASPSRIGRNPWCYDEVLRRFATAGETAGIGVVHTHSMRHTYRSWLDAVGTPIAVQQKLMRHADIRTTMNTYGDVVTDEMSQANSKVAGLALNGR